MIWLDVVKLALAFVPLVTSFMIYRRSCGFLTVDGLKKQRRHATVMIVLSVLCLLVGPVAAVGFGYVGAELWLNVVFGIAWATILGTQIMILRRARSALAGAS